MPNKEPGAIRQLFAFVGESNSKMRISILLAVLGEMFGIVPFLMVALLADELYRGTATIQRVLWNSRNMSVYKNASYMAFLSYVPQNFFHDFEKYP